MSKNNSINNKATGMQILSATGEYGCILEDTDIISTTYGNSCDIKVSPTNTNKITFNSTYSSDGNGLIVQNKKDDATAHSALNIKAANTASNAYLLVSNATKTYTFGATPVDSNEIKMVLSPSSSFNTGNIMEMRSSGEVNFPLQPSFSAFLSSTLSDFCGKTEDYFTITFNAEVWDIGNNFSTSTGVFTAPVDGIYSGNVTVLFNGTAAAGCGAGYVFIKAGSESLISMGGDYFEDNADVNDKRGFSGSFSAQMDAADEAYVKVMITGGSGDTVDVVGDATKLYTYFNGKLVC